jgi:vacuolar-type H+-ATPase subunit E/Vma4
MALIINKMEHCYGHTVYALAVTRPRLQQNYFRGDVKTRPKTTALKVWGEQNEQRLSPGYVLPKGREETPVSGGVSSASKYCYIFVDNTSNSMYRLKEGNTR